jgi:dCMP deaminase
MSRPSWDEYFQELTSVVASRSTCLRRKVGALIVRDKRILATGYNGAPSGLPHCLDAGCMREAMGIPSGERQELCRGLHAEQNAIIQAGLHGVSTKGGTIYVTLEPCVTCAKMIINAGIERVVYRDSYTDLLALQMMADAGLEVQRWDQTTREAQVAPSS